MRLSRSALLWAAFQLFVTTSAQQQFGRFGTRFRRSNLSLSSGPQGALPTDSQLIDASTSVADDLHATTSLPPQDCGDTYSCSTTTTPDPNLGDLKTYSSGDPLYDSTSTYSSLTKSSTDPYSWANRTSISSLPPNSTSSTATPTNFSDSQTRKKTKTKTSSSSTSSSSEFIITSPTLDPVSSCFRTREGEPSTVFSILYTETITWYGNPEDYTGFEDVTPTPCPGVSPSILISPIEPITTKTTILIGPSKTKAIPPPDPETYTFITTAKNPSVYYTTTDIPDYGGGSHPLSNDDHSSAKVKTAVVPDYGGGSGSTAAKSSPTDVKVEIRPTEVVINTLTVANNPASPTVNTVTVGTDVFTVGPSSIVGAGATITRSASATRNPATTTTIGGIGVVVSSTQAVIDGSTFDIGSTPTTQTVQGQVVTVGPGGVSISGIIVPVVSDTAQTQVVVAGAELITVIGPSIIVVDGTSYSYGHGSATITEVIDNDTIYIGPSGIVVDGTTLTVGNSETQYQIVGGATISEIGASVVVIEGTTWTIGPGTGATTTVIGGETITIGPSGVEIGTTMTLSYPFGPTSTTIIHPGATATAADASATAAASEDEEDSGFAVHARSSFALALLTTCIAIGVGFVGYIV